MQGIILSLMMLTNVTTKIIEIQSDKNLRAISLEKHMEYQRKLQKAGKMARIPNKFLNYTVKLPQGLAKPCGWIDDSNLCFETINN